MKLNIQHELMMATTFLKKVSGQKWNRTAKAKYSKLVCNGQIRQKQLWS